jgi:hypothetical protein
MPMGTFTAILHKEGDLYVADSPEVAGKQSKKPWPTSRKPRNSTWKNLLRSDSHSNQPLR